MNEAKLRGVNLGGWLVLEKWIAPSLFEGIDAADEYTFMQTPGSKEKLKAHRETFIVEEDFRWIAENGLNAVRIPVGYWLPGGDEPYASGVKHLDWAIEMAEKYSLKVLIDLHGAKGSQNGNDHSGRIGAANWYKNASFRHVTIEVLVQLAERYKASPAVWGIELLNEPKLGVREYFTLRKFYKEAYSRVSQAARPGTHIVFSDGFLPRLFSGALQSLPDYPTAMDVHWYQSGSVDIERYFKRVQARPGEIDRLQRRQPVIIGEWSGMLSHQALAGVPKEERAMLETRHIELQLQAYATAAGWFYWTYKTEAQGVWNFRWLVESGKFRLE